MRRRRARRRRRIFPGRTYPPHPSPTRRRSLASPPRTRAKRPRRERGDVAPRPRGRDDSTRDDANELRRSRGFHASRSPTLPRAPRATPAPTPSAPSASAPSASAPSASAPGTFRRFADPRGSTGAASAKARGTPARCGMHQRGARARRRIVLGDAVGRARGIRVHHVTSNLRGGDEENRVEGIRVRDGGCAVRRRSDGARRRAKGLPRGGDFGSARNAAAAAARQCSAAGRNCAPRRPRSRASAAATTDGWTIGSTPFEETVGVFGPAAGFGFDSDARFADAAAAAAWMRCAAAVGAGAWRAFGARRSPSARPAMRARHGAGSAHADTGEGAFAPTARAGSRGRSAGAGARAGARATALGLGAPAAPFGGARGEAGPRQHREGPLHEERGGLRRRCAVVDARDAAAALQALRQGRRQIRLVGVRHRRAIQTRASLARLARRRSRRDGRGFHPDDGG